MTILLIPYGDSPISLLVLEHIFSTYIKYKCQRAYTIGAPWCTIQVFLFPINKHYMISLTQSVSTDNTYTAN